MYCKSCGKEILEEAVVCPYCGVQLRELKREEAPAPMKNGMAIAGFVCSFLIPILGWIFGGIGLSRAKKRQGKGKGFSIAALVIATVNFIISLAMQ